MSDAYPDFTPVNLLTGFLGSGKTTLLRRLLQDPALADTAVLINEFGEVGLDHHLLERIDETMVLLQSGCLCCTIRGELAQAIRELHAKREKGLIPPFRRLVMESTGLADPFPVLSTLKSDPVLRHHFRAASVITTIDAVNGRSQLAAYSESVRQAAIADIIVLTKTDLGDETEIADLTRLIRTVNPDAPMIDAGHEPLDVASLLNGQRDEGPSAVPGGFYCEEPVGLIHQSTVTSFVMTVEQPIDWTAFGIWLTMLLNRHGDTVLRVKGILNIDGEDAPVAIHGVQHLVHIPVHMAAWPSHDRRSHIVFIVDGLDGDLVRRSFAAFNGIGRPAVSGGLKLVEDA